MHKRANVLSLEQRRTVQLLMYLHKENPVNLRQHVVNTRGADRDHFYVELYQNCKYKNSPFYKGAELWKLLPLHIATSESIFQLKQGLKREYKTYVNVLS